LLTYVRMRITIWANERLTVSPSLEHEQLRLYIHTFQEILNDNFSSPIWEYLNSNQSKFALMATTPTVILITGPNQGKSPLLEQPQQQITK
jgi:hypothetical protein